MFKKSMQIFLAFTLLVSCQYNFLKDASNQSSQEAYINDAVKALDAKDYDTAITILTTKLNVDYRTSNEVRRLTAEAFAGKCGLDTLDFLTGLGDSSSALFKIFTTPLYGVTTDAAYCKAATSKMSEIGVAGARTASDNTFLTVVSMARIGSAINQVLDTSPVGGDGTLEATSCTLTDAQVDEVILGLGFLIENITYVSSSLIGSGATTALTGLTSACTAVGINCSITDGSIIDATLRDTFRDLLNTTEFGVGSVTTGGDPVAIGLACP